MKKFKVTGTETVFYEMYINADNEDDAYTKFVENATDKDIVESCNFEVDDITEVEHANI